MENLYQEFKARLDSEKREDCVDWALAKLKSNEIDVVRLYTDVLTRALNKLECHEENPWACVWKEHVKTGIVRTIIECCYPFAKTARTARCGTQSKGKVLVLCPKDEYHELGARMVADFFMMAGYDAIFIGSNTPKEAILSAVALERPACVAISVSNPYHLFESRKMIEEIRARGGDKLLIVVGGQAVGKDPKTYEKIGANRQLGNFDDICHLAEEG